MFTRQQYLNKECTHREYYAQFVNESAKRLVRHYIGISRILDSQDEGFNDIPLALWGEIPFTGPRLTLEVAGDYPTVAGGICILKEAAQQIKESHHE